MAWGKGRVPVGIDTSDSDFNTVEKTGKGSAYDNIRIARNDSGLTTDGAVIYNGQSLLSINKNETTNAMNLDDMNINFHDPYIVCYMWKRTA